MIGILKKVGKWAIKTLKREAKKSITEKLEETPFEQNGIPRKKRRR